MDICNSRNGNADGVLWFPISCNDQYLETHSKM